MTTAAADFMTRFGQVWVTGKTDEVDELMPADVVYHLPPFPDMDREALKGFIAGFHQAFPDFTITIDENISDKDVSAHRWTCQATYTGESPLLPSPPTGKPTQATGSHFVHWHDGRPTEIWHKRRLARMAAKLRRRARPRLNAATSPGLTGPDRRSARVLSF